MESPYLASVYEYPSWILDFFAERKHKNECKEDWEQYFLELPIHLPNYTLLMTGYHENLEKPLIVVFNVPPSEPRHLHVENFMVGLRMAFHYLAWANNRCY